MAISPQMQRESTRPSMTQQALENHEIALKTKALACMLRDLIVGSPPTAEKEGGERSTPPLRDLLEGTGAHMGDTILILDELIEVIGGKRASFPIREREIPPGESLRRAMRET